MNDEKGGNLLLQKLYSETALIAWRELQQLFAQGRVIRIDQSLDLLVTAVSFARDDSSVLQPQIEQEKIAAPSNQVARQWYQEDIKLWSVVVAPYVLVQEQGDD